MLHRVAALVCACLLTLLAGAAPPAPADPREAYRALNALRVDPTQVYFVRELHLRRDIVRLAFSEGKLAFLAAYDGRVTGAVFTGRGRVIAVPRDPAEKRSLARFLGTPLLDEGFSRAYFRFNDDTADHLRRQLEAGGAQAASDPSFAEQWDPTVSNLNAWHSLRLLTDQLGSEPRPYFYAGLLGDAMGAFDVLVDSRRDEEVLLGQPRWVQSTRYYDVWASFPAANTPGALAPAHAPLAYAIATSIQPNRALEGETLLQLKTIRGGERLIALELSRFLSVEAVTDGEGQPLVFFQNEEVNRNDVARRGNDSLFIVLPQPGRAGEELRLRLIYRGNVISDAGNGVYYVGERGSWYPHLPGMDKFATFDLTFRWPQRLQLVATGKKAEESREGEWRTGRWRSTIPVPVAGFNLGEYASEQVESGPLRIELYANRQLEDALLSRFRRRTTVMTIPRLAPSWPRPAQAPAVIITETPPPSPATMLKQLGRDILEAIRFYEKLHGPFPFEQLAVSPTPGSLGQGWPGLLYLSTLSFLPPEAHQRVGIGQRSQEQFTELTPFHEVAHQWWGNLVGWSSYRDQWILEGLANYVTLLYADSKGSGEKILAEWLERYRNELTTKLPGQDETPEEAGPLMLGPRLRSSKSPAAYDHVIYSKGAWVFHMLRMMLRDPAAKDPDARFTQLLQSLLETHRHRAITTQDLQRAVEQAMTPQMALEGGRSMDWFFDQWVRSTGIPRYSVGFDVRPHGNSFLVRGKLKQTGVPDTFIAPVPLYAARTTGKPTLLGTLVTSGPETTFQFVTRARPKRILIDPNLTLLCLTD